MIIVEIAGHLGADAEERFTPSGKKVVSLRVAARCRQAGSDETVWWRVSIWGDRYDKLLPYLKKGSGVIIIGEMSKPETYVAKDGTTQVSLSLNAEIVKFSPFGRPEREQGGGMSEAAHASESYAGTYGTAESHASQSDDLPF